MNKCNKIISMLLILVLCFSMSNTAFAAESPVFQDVSLDSPWYEGVIYAASHGITAGTGNGCFSPDSNITARQWAVMLCRAYDKQVEEKPGSEFGISQMKRAFDEGWLDVGAMLYPDIGICRRYAYESIFRVEQIPVFSSTLYAEAPEENYFVHIAKENGLCHEAADALDLMTRGEAAQLIYLMQTKNIVVATPDILKTMNVINADGVNLNSFMLELKKIPEPILYEFKAQGWSYHVDREYVKQFSNRVGMECAGCCSYANKSIYVKADYATLHEIGHFFHKLIGFDGISEDLFEKESDAAARVLGTYATTNHKEYFAEVFDYWLRHDDHSKLEQVAPKTHAYFTALEKGNWKAVPNT